MRPTRRMSIDGLTVGRMRVVGQVGAWDGKLTKYAVLWSCCGSEERLSRASILARLSGHSSAEKCRHCILKTNLARGMPAVVPFTVGSVVGGVEILQVLEVGPTMPTTRYSGRYDCCGFVQEMNHSQLGARERLGRQSCGRCQRKDAATRKGKLPSILPPLPSVYGVVVRACGHDWPSLGPMGRR